ncbi:MAG: hypothetical protein ACQEVA_15565 [Myxococcota bacterium]
MSVDSRISIRRTMVLFVTLALLAGCDGQETTGSEDASDGGDTIAQDAAEDAYDDTQGVGDAGDASDSADGLSDGGDTQGDADSGPGCESELIHGEGEPLAMLGECGTLTYGLYANQGQQNAEHRLPDFSFAGYMKGGVVLPDVPEATTVAPGDGDDRQRIQDAIDQVSAIDSDADGFRGAVVLEAGTFEVDGTLEISASGVVLRGQGQGADGTTILATRAEQHDLISIDGGGFGTVDGTTTRIATGYVPVGATTFEVESASELAVGDTIGVVRTPNQTWIDDLGMDQWGWSPGGYEITFERNVVDLEGNRVAIDVPLVDTIEDAYGGGEVFVADTTSRADNIGVEDLRLVSEYNGNEDEQHGWKAVRMRGVSNSWVDGVTAVHFGYAAVSVERESSFVTVQDSAMLEPVSRVTGGRRYSFNVDDATGVLFQRCYSEQARHDFVAGSRTPGPNVWLDCYSRQSSNDDGPHHRWSTGLLFDNVRSYELHVENRQDSGSGHGWSGAQVLFWNSIAEGLRSFAPHAAMNWVVGSMGFQQEGQWTTEEPLGWWESYNDPVEPRSLYLQQLEDRLGAAAVEAVTIPEQRNGRIWGLLLGWSGEGALGAASAANGDSACSNGIENGLVCCASSCGTCGGSGCGGRPGGAESCCTSAVMESARSCPTHEAPCILDPDFASSP